MMNLPNSERRFDSVEQLDALPRELGWPLEYRQIEPGTFSSKFTDVEGDAWFLIEEQSNRRLEVVAGAPDGMFMMALFEGEPTVVNGQSVGDDQILVQTPGSDMRVTAPASVRATQIGVSEDLARDAIQAIAPEFPFARGNVGVFTAAPGRLESLRWAMRAAVLTPSSREATRDEAAYRILADLIATAADRDKMPSDCEVHRASARRALKRAMEYIEAHVDQAIRISSMCDYSGISLRSLERIFARDMGVSPQKYVIARRLNAVRRQLLEADREQGLTVTDVAQEHGFSHLGRFAGDYRRYFGESPRDTLLNN